MKVYRRDTTSEVVRMKRRTFLRSPCGLPPATPTGLIGDFDKVEAERHRRWRLRMRWTEVTDDTVGFPIQLRHYVVEVQYSADDATWYDAKRSIISAKFDDDAGTKATLIMRRIHPKLYYRFRVRAVARDGCKSAWSTYLDAGNPGTDEPPAPTAVKIKRGHNGIRLRWTPTDDPADSELIHDDIDHYVAELHSDSAFTSLYDRKRLMTHHQCKFRVEGDEDSGPYYGRVRAVSGSKQKSAWIPATAAGNSNPLTTPDGKRVMRDRDVHTFSLVGDAEVATYNPPDRWEDDVIITKVTGDFENAPDGADLIIDILVAGVSIFDDVQADMLTIEDGTSAGSTTAITNTTASENQKIKVSVVQVGSTTPGGNGTIRVIGHRTT